MRLTGACQCNSLLVLPDLQYILTMNKIKGFEQVQ